MMIQQMMMLMHLEMQLRQQALVSYQEAQDVDQRIQRLDDVMALNEQLNEVGSILGMLLNAPFDRRGEATRRAAAAAAGTESPPSVQHSPSPAARGHSLPPDGHLLLPRFRFAEHQPDIDDDDIDASSDEVTEELYGPSDVDDAVYDEDFGQAGSSPGHTVSVENMSVVGRSVGNHPSLVSGRDTDRWQVTARMPAPSSSTAFNGSSTVVLSRQRDQPSSPLLSRRRDQSRSARRMTVEQPAVSVAMNVLHLPASSPRSPSTAASSHTGTLPALQSAAAGGQAPAVRTPRTHDGDHVRPAVAAEQRAGSLSSTDSIVTSSRQPELLSAYRLPTALHGNTPAGARGQQSLVVSGAVVPQASSGNSSNAGSSSGVNVTQQTNSSQPSAHSSSVSTEPWPLIPAAESHASTSLSTNRSTLIAQIAARQHAESQHPQTRGRLTRNSRPSADATAASTHGPQRAVQQVPINHPTLPLRRSSVRNALGRPANPASVSTLRPRMVPLPHPPLRSRQQSFGNRGAASVRTDTSSDMLRPRRRSEITHEIMFPPQNDTD